MALCLIFVVIVCYNLILLSDFENSSKTVHSFVRAYLALETLPLFSFFHVYSNDGLKEATYISIYTLKAVLTCFFEYFNRVFFHIKYTNTQKVFSLNNSHLYNQIGILNAKASID